MNFTPFSQNHLHHTSSKTSYGENKQFRAHRVENPLQVTAGRAHKYYIRRNPPRHSWQLIGRQLGIKIDPASVRLLPQSDDSYSWAALPGKESLFKQKLFQKHLSKLSIGPLIELCHGVGNTFQAVFSSENGDINSAAALPMPHDQPTNLVSDVLRLKKELKRVKRKKQGLARQNQRQRILIDKFRSIAHGILQVTSFPDIPD